jgi:hypothetical protein
MPTIFAQPYDNAFAALTVAHASGGAALTLDTVSRLPSSISTDLPIYVTVMNTSTSGTTQFKATSLVGSSLSGLTVIGRNADALYPSGSTVEMRIVAQHFADYNASITGFIDRSTNRQLLFNNGGYPSGTSRLMFNPNGNGTFGINAASTTNGSSPPIVQLSGITTGGVTKLAQIELDTSSADVALKVVNGHSNGGFWLLNSSFLLLADLFVCRSRVYNDQGTPVLFQQFSPTVCPARFQQADATQSARLMELTNSSDTFLAGADHSGRFIQRCLPSLPTDVPVNGTTVFITGVTPYMAVYNGAWRSGLFV